VEQAGPRVVAAELASIQGLASTQAAVPAQGEIPAAVVRQGERAAERACLAPALALSQAELQVDFPDESFPDDSLEQDAFPDAVAVPGDWLHPLAGSAELPAEPQNDRAARDALPPQACLAERPAEPRSVRVVRVVRDVLPLQAGCQPTDCQPDAVRFPG
jgi:hypothetical protein